MSYPVYTGMKSAGPSFIQWLGFVVCALALPLFLIAGWSLGGWALGAGLFAANRGSAIAIDRIARGKMQVTAVGISGMGFISRAWITFGLLFAFAHFFDKHVGIVAALSFLVYFTIDTLARTLTFVAARGHREPGEAA